MQFWFGFVWGFSALGPQKELDLLHHTTHNHSFPRELLTRFITPSTICYHCHTTVSTISLSLPAISTHPTVVHQGPHRASGKLHTYQHPQPSRRTNFIPRPRSTGGISLCSLCQASAPLSPLSFLHNDFTPARPHEHDFHDHPSGTYPTLDLP